MEFRSKNQKTCFSSIDFIIDLFLNLKSIISRMTKTILLFFVITSSLLTFGQDANTSKNNMEAQDQSELHLENFIQKTQNIQNADSLKIIVQEAISETGKNRQAQAQIYQKAGELFRSLHLFDKTIENYLESLRIYESLNDSVKIADVSNLIGNIYLISQRLDETIEFSSRARDIYLSIHDENGILSSSLTIGAAYQKKRDFDNALKIYSTALQNAQSPEFVVERAILLGNTGSSYVALGKLDSGLTYLQRSLSIKEKHSSEGSIIHTLNDLSELMLLMGDLEESKKYATEAQQRSEASGNSNQLRWAHLSLSKIAKQTGNYEDAYNHFLEYYHINDSLFGLEKENQINELQVKYETEKKDQAITTLHKEKEIADLKTSIYLIGGILILLIGAALYNWQRVRAIRNQKLLEKEQELDRMKASFFANISHEFRTPLTLIMSPIETMLEQETREQHRHHLEIMQKSGKRLLRLINQILDLSKIEAGHLKLEFRNVDLISYLKEITFSFSALCNSKNISLEFKTNIDNFNISCDAAKLNTVISNLISNAVKNTGEGGHISVFVNADREKHQVEIKVADTGIGIPEDKLPHIFDRYYQVDGGKSSPETPGSGIGLALAKQLVELHKGSIDVTSKINEGTSFHIVLPLEPEQILESIPEAELAQIQLGFDSIQNSDEHRLAEAETTEEINDGLPLVLIIEDNADVRFYVKSILINDYQIIEAENGKQGVEKAQLHIPDLIISDVMMPEMDGYEACRRIKKDEKTSHIPVILLTAKASVDSRITGLETEADMYLSKPFVPRELMAGIRNLIESRKRLRERYNREIHLKPADISMNSVDEQFLTKLMSVLEVHYSNADFTVDQLGKEVGMSRSQIHRKLQALTNESSSRFIRTFRLQRAMDMITQRAGTISEISYMVGFSSPSYFNKCFLEHYGCTPSTVLEK